jgi:hypothetical protein
MFAQVLEQAAAVTERVRELCIRVVVRYHRLQAEVVADAMTDGRDRCVLTRCLKNQNSYVVIFYIIKCMTISVVTMLVL